MSENRPSKANWPYSTWPESYVTRVDKSPMNPKVKLVTLNCKHEVWRNRAPRLGAVIICHDCARKAEPR